MRLAFFGSPDFAVPALHALVQAGHEIVATYCQPPRPAGRGQAVTRCAVHVAADTLGLEVRTPTRLKRDIQAHADFAALKLDAAIVAAYGLILPAAMLDAPKQGCLNIHASLLPRWRGAAPIHAAIMAGDAQTGITIMRMDEGLDTGAMLLAETLPIGPTDTTPILQTRLAAMGAALILRALTENPPAIPQPETGASYAPKLTREDGKLDFSHDAAALDRQIRALTPWPGSFAMYGGEALKILVAEPVAGSGAPGTVLDAGFTVACGAGAIRLIKVQRPGRPAVAGDAFLRGVQSNHGLLE